MGEITVDMLDHTKPGWTTCQSCHHWWRSHYDGRCNANGGCDCADLVAVLVGESGGTSP